MLALSHHGGSSCAFRLRVASCTGHFKLGFNFIITICHRYPSSMPTFDSPDQIHGFDYELISLCKVAELERLSEELGPMLSGGDVFFLSTSMVLLRAKGIRCERSFTV